MVRPACKPLGEGKFKDFLYPINLNIVLLSACRVSDLARLSLVDPEYIAVHAEATIATPHRLRQFFITCPLERKLDLLWFFIKTHLKKRTIVFLATCKQVRLLSMFNAIGVKCI
jgi:superfamily II DNA/RNA helicase